MNKFLTFIACGLLSVSAIGCGPDNSVSTPTNTAPAPTSDESGNAGQTEQTVEDTVPGK